MNQVKTATRLARPNIGGTDISFAKESPLRIKKLKQSASKALSSPPADENGLTGTSAERFATNLLEAIRWVMGSSKIHARRRMEDVIFGVASAHRVTLPKLPSWRT
jgi:hypothetical protein